MAIESFHCLKMLCLFNVEAIHQVEGGCYNDTLITNYDDTFEHSNYPVLNKHELKQRDLQKGVELSEISI